MNASDHHRDSPTARKLRVAGEVVLLALIALSPWAFGCVHARDEFFLALGIAALLALWAAHTLVTRRFSFHFDPVAICLMGLVIFTAVQVAPWPESVVRMVSPTAAQWHAALLPETPELLPGETEAPHPSPARLTVAPAATEDLLVRLLAVFVVYAAARNFISSSASFRRLAWTGFATGVGLAVLGLAQYLAGDRTRIYGEEIGVQVFGPFANKNHFAFQVNLFAGLAIGLFLHIARRPKGWHSPEALAVLGGLGLMAAAVAFSQSRGGGGAALAAAGLVGVTAWTARNRDLRCGTRAGLVLAVGVALVAGILIAWFGWRGAADRFATLFSDDAGTRAEDWRSVWPLVEQFPATGVGGGGLRYAEPMVRTRSDLSYEFNTLDNEYLEALVEGGIPRLALTLALAVAAIGMAIAAYRRDPSRGHAPFALGCAFGLAAVAIQSIGDFGLHSPSVAVTAAVVAAFAARPSRDEAAASTPTLGGAYAATIATLLLLAGLLISLAEWRLFVVDRLRLAAGTAMFSAGRGRDGAAIRYLESAARVRPNDPAIWNDLAGAHLLAAAQRQEAILAAVTGSIAYVFPPAAPPAGDPDGHMTAALRAARASRDHQPLGAYAHLTLGALADRFEKSEPATVHFDRGKRVAGFDPDTWYASAAAAAERGDWPTALAEWKESLRRSPRWLASVCRRAATRVSPAEFRAQALPDDPEVWFAATPHIFPDRDDPRRLAWYQAIADRWVAGPEPASVAGFVGWGTALEEVGTRPAALRVWRNATARFPEETAPRDRLAACLEADEQFEEAIPVLEWLTSRHPRHGGYATRLEAARHAVKLKAIIDGK